MSEEKRLPTQEEVLGMIAELRYFISDLEQSIGSHFATRGEFWQDVRTRLITLEARLASLEVRLAGVPKEYWHMLEPDFLLKELKEIGADLLNMHTKFLEFAQEFPQ
jgi:hypothetical protein